MRLLRRTNAMTKSLILILGDQLSRTLSPLMTGTKSTDVVLMVEVSEEATYVPHHKKKIAFLFSAMRHFADALKEGAQIAGILPLEPNQPKRAAPAPIKTPPTQETEAAAQTKRIQAARYYYNSAHPIDGTLGERYLREHRKITGDISAVKFHPRIRDTIYNKKTGEKTVSYHPGIVFAAKNAAGDITAAQTILLNRETGNKVDTAKVGVVKRSRGVVQGSAVCVQRRQGHCRC